MPTIPGYEHLVAARFGRMLAFSGTVERKGPAFCALQVGIHACSQAAVSGILADLLRKGRDGTGGLVETSLLRSMMPYEMGGLIHRQFPDRFPDALAAAPAEPPMPALFYHPAQAGDGRWIQFGNLLPHLFDNFLMVTGLTDLLTDADWDPAQLCLPVNKQEAFRQRMLARIQERPARDWIEDCIDNGSVVAAVYQSTQQALDDPDLLANGHVVARPKGGVQLGPLARLTATPALPGGDCMPDDGLEAAWRSDPRPSPLRPLPETLPLAGIRVVEVATIIAAPLGASFLADMGADVVKVEQPGGDPFRGMLQGLGSAKTNAGKRSICLDLKAAAGRNILLQLLEEADVLIHNYRPGVPERLGMGYEQVSAINPGIIYLQCNGYGPDGPGAHRPCTHPVPGAAMGSVVYQLGERLPDETLDMPELISWTRRLMQANDVNPDPATAMVVATSALLGLKARQTTGKGQRVLVDMLGANAYANADDFLTYPGKPPRRLPDRECYGLSATYRLYACADGGWVFLALVGDRDLRRFVAVLRQAGIDCPDESCLSGQGAEPAEILADLFAGRSADTWERLLAPAGIGCVRADQYRPAEFLQKNEQVHALGMTTETQHPVWGRYRRYGASVTFNRQESATGGPPLAGQHCDEILTRLGYSADAISTLLDEGVIWAEQAPAASGDQAQDA